MRNGEGMRRDIAALRKQELYFRQKAGLCMRCGKHRIVGIERNCEVCKREESWFKTNARYVQFDREQQLREIERGIRKKCTAAPVWVGPPDARIERMLELASRIRLA